MVMSERRGFTSAGMMHGEGVEAWPEEIEMHPDTWRVEVQLGDNEDLDYVRVVYVDGKLILESARPLLISPRGFSSVEINLAGL